MLGHLTRQLFRWLFYLRFTILSWRYQCFYLKYDTFWTFRYVILSSFSFRLRLGVCQSIGVFLFFRYHHFFYRRCGLSVAIRGHVLIPRPYRVLILFRLCGIFIRILLLCRDYYSQVSQVCSSTGTTGINCSTYVMSLCGVICDDKMS